MQIDLSWTVVQDDHAGSVIEVSTVAGIPVLAHAGGRYPSLQGPEGRTTRDTPYIEIWEGGSTTTHADGRVERTPGPYVVTAIGTWHHGRRRSLCIGETASLEAARALLPTAAEALLTLDARYDLAIEVDRAVGSGPMSRDEYEAACAAWRVRPRADSDFKYADFFFEHVWPERSMGALPRALLDQRRAVTYQRERDEAAEAERRAAMERASHEPKPARRSAVRCPYCGAVAGTASYEASHPAPGVCDNC